MKNIYIKPMIEVVPQQYNEGLMQEWSTGAGTGDGGGQPAKPGGEWGDTWNESETDNTWE